MDCLVRVLPHNDEKDAFHIFKWASREHMILPSKKNIFILSSTVFGVFIVLITAKATGLLGVDSKNENGNSEWSSSLSVVSANNSPTRTQKGNVTIDANVTEATSTTNLIAQRLVAEYLIAQRSSATSTINDTDAKNIANLLAQEVALPPEKDYQLKDLNISTSNSSDAYTLYAKALSALITKHTATEQQENDLTILITAMNTGDAATLSKLKGKVDLYQKLINDLLALTVPSSLAPIHLHLIENYEALRSATVGLESMLTDSAIGTAALARYKEGSDGLNTTSGEYVDFFAKQSIQ